MDRTHPARSIITGYMTVFSALKSAAGEIDAPRVSFWTTAPDGFSSLVAAEQRDSGKAAPLGLVLPPRTGLVGIVAKTRQELAIEEVAKSSDHLSVSRISSFFPGAILSAPVLIRGEVWGVVQILDDQTRRWTSAERRAAQYFATQIGLQIAELFVPSREVISDSSVSLLALRGMKSVTHKIEEATVLCVDLVKSIDFLKQEVSNNSMPLAALARYLETAVHVGSKFAAEAIAAPGDAIALLFQHGDKTRREQDALLCVGALREAFSELRQNRLERISPLKFHCAVASGSVELGRLAGGSHLIECSLGLPLHQAFALTKDVSLVTTGELLAVPGVTQI